MFLFFLLLVTAYSTSTNAEFISKASLREFRDEIQEMFYHAYNNYLEHAFPDDELKPISCSGRKPEGRGTLDDTLGNFALTLVDSLDTLLIFGDTESFSKGLKLIVDNVHFDNDVTVSVFEVTIRMLGGLLSSHLLVKDRNLTEEIPWYNGQLLNMAEDLASRLLPAFNTKTGVPISRINLRHGVSRGETDLTCTACAGTLSLEFSLLSRLTGDKTYENVAMKALKFLLSSKSNIGLFGSMMNTTSGIWAEPLSSIGAGSDSFYEYIYKTYLYFDLPYNDFFKSYQSALTYLRTQDDWYMVSNMFTGHTAFQWTDSLAAFWPGLQADIGDIEAARRGHRNYLNIWNRYNGIPERYSVFNKVAVGGMQNYPLRPEFVESTYLLYRATKDPFYLNVGKSILQSLRRFRVKCGYASVHDVQTLHLEDRMDSFFLTETLKYLFLLFDENNWIHKSNYLFTTEAHLLPFNLDWHRKTKNIANVTCPVIPPKQPDYLRMLPEGHVKPPAVIWPSCALDSVPPMRLQFQISGLQRHEVGQFGVTQVESTREAIIGFFQPNEDQNTTFVNGSFYAQTALFGPVLNQPIQGQLVASNPPDLCQPSLIDLTGKIVFVVRGFCTFYEKIQNAQHAGAIGVIIANNHPTVFAMSGVPELSHHRITIPSWMITSSDGAYLSYLLSPLSSPQIVIISPKNLGRCRHTSRLQFVFKGSSSSIFRKLIHEMDSMDICHSNAFVNEDSIIFSLSNDGMDLSNSRIEITWADPTQDLNLQLTQLEVTN